MQRRQLNRSQRVILVIGLGFALSLFGDWVTALGSRANVGWVAYAPLSSSYNFPAFGGFHPWVRLVMWLVLIAVWTGLSVLLLRGSHPGPRDDAVR